MIIKVGTLCWLVNVEDDDLRCFAGRVVEVVAPLAVREYRSRRLNLCYMVTAPWMVSLARAMGYDWTSFAIAPRHLLPFSDPNAQSQFTMSIRWTRGVHQTRGMS